MNEDAKRRIMTYYDMLAKKENNPSAADTMKNMVEVMSDEDIVELEIKLEKNDSFYNRLTAYASRFSKLDMVAEERAPYGLDSSGKNAKTMNEMYSAMSGYDVNQDVRETINGNTFIHKKTFPVDDYREEFNAIGEKETGNEWYVKLDDEGKLVIY